MSTAKISTFALSLSKKLNRFPRFHNFARRIYCCFFPGINFLIEKSFRYHKKIFVLKIGANDGLENDPIADFLMLDSRYTGVLVEPVPHYAKCLSKNYKNTGRFRIEQVAIAAISGTTNIYHIAENSNEVMGYNVPDWLRGIASLDRNLVLDQLSSQMHKLVVETSVESLTVNDLLTRLQIRGIDLLHIDAEGFDWIILQQFNLSEIRPKVILFERKHLSQEDETAAVEYITSAGFKVKSMESDFLCILE